MYGGYYRTLGRKTEYKDIEHMPLEKKTGYKGIELMPLVRKTGYKVIELMPLGRKTGFKGIGLMPKNYSVVPLFLKGPPSSLYLKMIAKMPLSLPVSDTQESS